MAPAKRIEQWEIDRYWDIFSSLAQGSTHLDGNQAASVLKNSQLRDDQLERIWDLADVDNDGRLDFEEFCVAMRLIFDIVNGEYSDVPQNLPDWMVPESKAHLIQATHAISGRQPQFERVDDYSDESNGLKDGFDWYMSPSDRTKYSEIYSANRDPSNGGVTFDCLEPLYESLDVPDTDLRSAWNLVNPRSDASIGKDATLAFLHILNNRHEGFRIPRSVPPSLSSTFQQTKIDYQVDKYKSAADRWGTRPNPSDPDNPDTDTPSARKARFGDAYLARLGVGDRAGNRPRGTDFGSARTDDEWEEVRLQKQLRGLEEQMARVEEAAQRKRDRGGRREHSKPALVKRELSQLLDWKRRELDVLNGKGGASGGAGSGPGSDLGGVAEDIAMVKEQIDGLEAHLKKREAVLEGLREQIRNER